jgi:DNA polymerase-3 subunit alpha (Gram-positive type)
MMLVYDCETSGLPIHPNADIRLQPEIIELGGVYIDRKTGKPRGKVSMLIKPSKPVSAEITTITGISNDMLEGKPSFKKAWPMVVAAFAKATMTIAHNSPFDEFILNIEAKRIGERLKWPKRLCTISLYRDVFGYDPKLVDLYEHVIGSKLDQKHRAMSDVEALVEIVRKDQLWKL